MPMPSWLPIVLAVQLIISFFIPSFGLGSRNVFIGDLFCFAWTGLLLIRALRHAKASVRSLCKFLLLSELVILVIYGHGYYRPTVQASLHSIGFYIGDESDLFNPLREMVIALRFLSWLWAGSLIALVFSKQEPIVAKKALKPVEYALAFSMIVASTLMLVSKALPSVRNLLGGIYRYNPNYEYWRGRMYGVFSSPVEAGAVLALATTLVLASLNLSRGVRVAAFVAGIIGMWLTHTLTAMISFVVAGGYFLMTTKVPRRYRKAIYGTGAFLLVALGAWLAHDPNIAIQKLNDLQARSQSWAVYLPALAARWDYWILGFGFASYPTDNSYLFLFLRGGLFALFAAGISMGYLVRKYWSTWSSPSRSALIYTFLAGAMLDIFIYRHAAILWIVLGIPFLSRRSA